MTMICSQEIVIRYVKLHDHIHIKIKYQSINKIYIYDTRIDMISIHYLIDTMYISILLYGNILLKMTS